MSGAKFGVALCLASLLVVGVIGVAQRPVVGILSSPFDEADPTQGSFILSHYVQFLEGAGARVVPILYDWPAATLASTLSRVNGVLFTGGGLSLLPSTQYFKQAKLIWDTAQAMHASGDDLPIWGTCMGFQILCVLAANNRSILLEYAFDSESINWPLTFTAAAKSSTLFGTASASLYTSLATEPITVNLHHDGVEPQAWSENPQLAKTFSMLSTNVDRRGRPFVSSIESHKGLAPVFALQWHAERPAFCWDPSENATHEEVAIEAGQWVARRFMAVAKASKHAYESDAAVPLIEKDSSVRRTWDNCWTYPRQA